MLFRSNYLEESGLKQDVKNLLTNYSLEVHASVNLRRLAEPEQAPKEERKARKVEPEERDEVEGE